MARVVYMAGLLLASSLAGCGGSSLLDMKASQAGAATVAPAVKPARMVTLVPVAGAPVQIQDQIARLVTPVAFKQNVILRSDGAATNDYALRGYLMIDRGKSGAKLLYVWDLLDGAGNRVNRAAGEEPLMLDHAAADPWSHVPAASLAVVAEKVTEILLSIDQTPRRVAAAPNPPSGAGAPVEPVR